MTTTLEQKIQAAEVAMKEAATEQFKEHPYYKHIEVGDQGHVRSKATAHVYLPFLRWNSFGHIEQRAYFFLDVVDGRLTNQTNRAVAELVLEAWAGLPNHKGHAPYHANGDTLDDRLSNLRWSPPEQIRSRIKSAKHTVTPDEERKIVELTKEGLAQSQIAVQLRLPTDYVSTTQITRGLGVNATKRAKDGRGIAYEEPSDEVLAVIEILKKGNHVTAYRTIQRAMRVALDNTGITLFFNGKAPKSEPFEGRHVQQMVRLAIREVFGLPYEQMEQLELKTVRLGAKQEEPVPYEGPIEPVEDAALTNHVDDFLAHRDGEEPQFDAMAASVAPLLDLSDPTVARVAVDGGLTPTLAPTRERTLDDFMDLIPTDIAVEIKRVRSGVYTTRIKHPTHGYVTPGGRPRDLMSSWLAFSGRDLEG